ncbi:glycoprotein [Streptomyces sp. NPDC000963]
MTHTGHELAADIDTALEAAEAFADTYRDYDTGEALNRIGDPATARALPASAIPSRYPTVHEQAAHDLDLAATLIVDAPQAHLSLTRLLEPDPAVIEPEGALVFAALLHLAGYRDQSQFWFEFAAGAGSSTAAFCLTLLHQKRAEHRTAAHWRAQALPSVRPPVRPAPSMSPACPLLPDDVRRSLISRCWEGRRPVLPARLEAVIHSLPVAPDDDFGDIPRPDDTLIRLSAPALA